MNRFNFRNILCYLTSFLFRLAVNMRRRKSFFTKKNGNLSSELDNNWLNNINWSPLFIHSMGASFMIDKGYVFVHVYHQWNSSDFEGFPCHCQEIQHFKALCLSILPEKILLCYKVRWIATSFSKIFKIPKFLLKTRSMQNLIPLTQSESKTQITIYKAALIFKFI